MSARPPGDEAEAGGGRGPDRRRVLHVGSDKVTMWEGRLEVLTAHPMEEWEPGGHRRSYVRFRGATYAIDSVDQSAKGRVRYLLSSADPDASLGIPGQVIDYDVDYVATRDRDLRARRVATTAGIALWLVMPLLGFLWSGVKKRLHERYGFHPQTVTELSFWVQMGCVGLIAFSVLLKLVIDIPTGPFVAMLALAPVLYLDFAVRRARTLVPSLTQFGLLEWIFRRFRDGD